MSRTRHVALCLALLLGAGCQAPMSQPSDGPPQTDLPSEPPSFALAEPDLEGEAYVPGGGPRQTLDVYLPAEGDGPFPTLLAFHGGGFRARSKLLYAPMAGHFTAQGIALVAANYRFTSSASYPAQVEDAFCALAWVHANAETYGFDRERIFAVGDSAGGYLAAMLGTVDAPDSYQGDCPNQVPETDPLRGAIVLYGFYDLVSLDGHREADIRAGLEPLMGAPHSEVPPERLAEMSPLSWVDGSEPPFLIIHGNSDRVIQSRLSENFAAALEGAGVEVELILPEADHGFILQPVSSPTMTLTLEAIEAFLERHAGS